MLAVTVLAAPLAAGKLTVWKKQGSRDYYRSKKGKIKIKKKYLNARRNGRQPELSPNEKPTISAEFEVDKTTVFHIQMVTTLIEGRSVTIKEIIRLIDRIVRQHSSPYKTVQINNFKKLHIMVSGTT